MIGVVEKDLKQGWWEREQGFKFRQIINDIFKRVQTYITYLSISRIFYCSYDESCVSYAY